MYGTCKPQGKQDGMCLGQTFPGWNLAELTENQRNALAEYYRAWWEDFLSSLQRDSFLPAQGGEAVQKWMEGASGKELLPGCVRARAQIHLMGKLFPALVPAIRLSTGDLQWQASLSSHNLLFLRRFGEVLTEALRTGAPNSLDTFLAVWQQHPSSPFLEFPGRCAYPHPGRHGHVFPYRDVWHCLYTEILRPITMELFAGYTPVLLKTDQPSGSDGILWICRGDSLIGVDLSQGIYFLQDTCFRFQGWGWIQPQGVALFPGGYREWDGMHWKVWTFAQGKRLPGYGGILIPDLSVAVSFQDDMLFLARLHLHSNGSPEILEITQLNRSPGWRWKALVHLPGTSEILAFRYQRKTTGEWQGELVRLTVPSGKVIRIWDVTSSGMIHRLHADSTTVWWIGESVDTPVQFFLWRMDWQNSLADEPREVQTPLREYLSRFAGEFSTLTPGRWLWVPLEQGEVYTCAQDVQVVESGCVWKLPGIPAGWTPGKLPVPGASKVSLLDSPQNQHPAEQKPS